MVALALSASSMMLKALSPPDVASGKQVAPPDIINSPGDPGVTSTGWDESAGRSDQGPVARVRETRGHVGARSPGDRGRTAGGVRGPPPAAVAVRAAAPRNGRPARRATYAAGPAAAAAPPGGRPLATPFCAGAPGAAPGLPGRPDRPGAGLR